MHIVLAFSSNFTHPVSATTSAVTLLHAANTAVADTTHYTHHLFPFPQVQFRSSAISVYFFYVTIFVTQFECVVFNTFYASTQSSLRPLSGK